MQMFSEQKGVCLRALKVELYKGGRRGGRLSAPCTLSVEEKMVKGARAEGAPNLLRNIY